MSTAALRMTSRPWKDVVITFTGVENKVSVLFHMARTEEICLNQIA